MNPRVKNNNPIIIGRTSYLSISDSAPLSELFGTVYKLTQFATWT